MDTEKIFGVVLGLITYLGALLYFAGRIYYEWYYQGFGINYKMLDFGSLDCIFSSYTTVFLAASLFPIVYSIGIYCESGRSMFLLIAILHFVVALIVVPFLWPIKFDPFGNAIAQFLGSKDLVIMTLGLAFFLLLLVSALASPERWQGFGWPSKPIKMWPVWFPVIVFLSMFVILGVVAFFEGKYQSRAAIWEGKMGTRWTQKKGDHKWYIYVVRTSDGRNFIYDRIKKTPIYVRDDEIMVINGPVTGKEK